jgi:hypothetical protein
MSRKSVRWIILAAFASLATSYVTKRMLCPIHLTSTHYSMPKYSLPTISPDEMTRQILIKAARHDGRIITVDTAAMWVRVANSSPVRSIYREYAHGETCFVEERNKAVLISIENDHLLLWYAPRLPSSGSICPSGTQFFMTLEPGTVLNPRKAK